LLLSAVCLLSLCGRAAAGPVPETPGDPLWAISEENDLLANPFGRHTDRHYTQGLEFTFLDGVSRSTNWITRLPAWGLTVEQHRAGFVLGQSIYTPEDLQATQPIPTDRPYAGWLYAGLIAARRGTAWERIPCLETAQLQLGVIGPESLAAEAQTVVHRWRGFATPKGWENQLQTEPGLALKYARLWRWSPGSPTHRWLDVLPQLGASLGNVATRAEIGTTLRLGYHLPDDFGPQTIDSDAALAGGVGRKPRNFGVYLFLGVTGRAVGYTTFLDGNLFRDGPSVEREPFVADTDYGFGFVLFKHLELTYTHVFRSREFRGQHDHDEFGSVSATCRFAF
jgi:lipid A 3-O-deacylase